MKRFGPGRAATHRAKKKRRTLALLSPEFDLSGRTALLSVAGLRCRYFCFRIHARGFAHLFKTYRSTSNTLPFAPTLISCPMIHFRARSPPFQIDDDDGGGVRAQMMRARERWRKELGWWSPPILHRDGEHHCRICTDKYRYGDNKLLAKWNFSPFRAHRSRSTKVKGVLGGVRVRASQDRAQFSLSASLYVRDSRAGLGYRITVRPFAVFHFDRI